MLSTVFVVLAMEWALGIMRRPTIAGVLGFLLAFAIIAMAAQLIALGVVTARRLHRSGRAA